MAKEAMDDCAFEQVLSKINQETGSTDKKLEILFSTRGYYSAHQAARILHAFGIPSDKVRAIQILEPRLTRMTGSEARDILASISIQNDKLKALECIKRVLTDNQSTQGMEGILSGFPFEMDKSRALDILYTTRSDVVDAVPAGGHQGYAALGGLYTQSRPLVPHLYGSLEEQHQRTAGYGRVELPVETNQGMVPSLYTGHPSYAYPQGRDYATDRGYPGNRDASFVETHQVGIESVGQHSGGPTATGFPNLDYYK